jgi:GTP:adenosylcobinamide-phosphate guanylyltransferase
VIKSFRSIILAGTRNADDPLATANGVDTKVLIPVAGNPSLNRVYKAIQASECIDGGIIVGPNGALASNDPTCREILADPKFEWIEPHPGPAASAIAALNHLEWTPVFLTAGDHALLTPNIIDTFCRGAAECDADMVIGLVPMTRVRKAFPHTKRTIFRFADGERCGSNLFAFLTPAGKQAVTFWSRIEQQRKKPWKILQTLGIGILARYVLRQLTLTRALHALSVKSGCRIAFVTVNDPRAAVDIDSTDDLKLAEAVLLAEQITNRE